MARRNGLAFVIILAIFAFTLWTIIPLNGERFGRQGMRLGLDLVGGVHLVYQVTTSDNASVGDAVDRALVIIQKRIDTFGVTEPIIQKLGEDRILVQLPVTGRNSSRPNIWMARLSVGLKRWRLPTASRTWAMALVSNEGLSDEKTSTLA